MGPEEAAAPEQANSPAGADTARARARRALHIAVSAAAIYWWFPERVAELSVTRDQLVLAAIAVVLALEAIRLWRGALPFPMRAYERSRLGGHAWLVVGCAVAVLFFEQQFAMVTILGTTLVDPLLGELRAHGQARIAPFVGIAAWAAQASVWILVVPLPTPWQLVPLGAVVAVAGEAVDIPWVDDNFTMNLAPLAAMAAAGALLA